MDKQHNNEALVGIHYKLFLIDNKGKSELFEETEKGQPYFFRLGEDEVLPAFEQYFKALKPNDTFNFSISKEDAYGDYDESMVMELPISAFSEDDDLDEDIEVGEYLSMVGENEEAIEGKVVEIKEDTILMDFNHPMAGKTLKYEGIVVTIRA
jgi:FKBP-type peptidyl-prolyl cis-trans isomerase SlyD